MDVKGDGVTAAMVVVGGGDGVDAGVMDVDVDGGGGVRNVMMNISNVMYCVCKW